jgi:hydrogenase expression/formation protein HypE
VRPHFRWDLSPGGGTWIGAEAEGTARVLVHTGFGSTRLLLPASGELLPRIC